MTLGDYIRAAASLHTPLTAAFCSEDNQEAYRLANLGMDIIDSAMTIIEDADFKGLYSNQYDALKADYDKFEFARQDARIALGR